MPDVTIENHGTIMLFRPVSDEAGAWLEENVSPDAQWLGDALAVEPRYAAALAEGLIDAGFSVE